MPRKYLRTADLPAYLLGRCLETPSGCWLWEGAKDPRGYGLARISGKTVRVHRVSYEVFSGPIPCGMYVCHRCDNRACFNPDHLFVGTHADNMRDMVQKGRQARQQGATNPRAKLTREQVLEIRSLVGNGARQADVARRFGVTRQNIFAIVSGVRWEILGS